MRLENIQLSEGLFLGTAAQEILGSSPSTPTSLAG